MLPVAGTGTKVPTIAELFAAEVTSIQHELEHKGMNPSIAKRVAEERVTYLPAKVEPGLGAHPSSAEGHGFFQDLGEGLTDLWTATGFGAGVRAGSTVAGKPTPAQQLGHDIRAAEAPPEHLAEQAPGAVAGWVTGFGELLKSYGPRLLELLAGGVLIIFGLVTLARGGRPPSVPKPGIR